MSKKTYKLRKPFRQGKELLTAGDEIELTDKQATAFADFIKQPEEDEEVKPKGKRVAGQPKAPEGDDKSPEGDGKPSGPPK